MKKLLTYTLEGLIFVVWSPCMLIKIALDPNKDFMDGKLIDKYMQHEKKNK